MGSVQDFIVLFCVCCEPSFLKPADVIPVSKKDSKNSKHNYRPISVLKIISKVYERAMCKQIGDFMEFFFQNFNVALGKTAARSDVLLL